jgi:hypothetical protein
VSVPSNGQLLIGNGSGFVNSTLTAGTGISISNGAGSITINATDGNITLDDGTAAAPSLNFTDDPNTGLYRPAADTVGIVGGGHDILRLTDIASATDYVQIKNGIGVGSPLHIIAEGASANIGMHLQPKGSGLLTISDGTDFNKGIRFRSSSSAASAVTLIDAVSTAGRVITLPDATDTLVGKATTDTLTNKTLTSPTLTTPISETLTSPAATNLTLGTGSFGTALTVASATGNVSISSTTAGSAGAGALVIAGGLAAAGASYFGGAVTAPGFYTGAGNSGAAEFKNSVSGSPQTMGLFNTSTAASSDVAYGFQTQGSRTCNWLLSRSTGLLEFTDGYQTRGNVRASFDMNTGDATFAGAVAIGNTVSSVSPTSPNRTITMVVGGVTLYIAAKTTND